MAARSIPAERRFTFDEIPDLYDRVRPGYPESLCDDLVAISGLPAGGRVLEIGCGTGQLTVPLAERGYSILCLEPGPAIAAFARQKLEAFPRVEVVESTFEAWPSEPGAFDLVVSAQAFHWVEPEVGFAKAAEALTRSGVLAVVGNAHGSERSSIDDAVDAVYARHAPTLSGPPVTRWYAEGGPVAELFSSSGHFQPVERRHYPWSESYSADDYCDLLRTHSDHRLLPRDQRESLLRALSEVISSHGGTIDVEYTANLYAAARAA